MLRRWGFGRSLAVVTAVGLALRVAYVVGFRFSHLPIGLFTSGDAWVYSRGGVLLALGKGFVMPADRSVQFADHPPLFIMWLSIPTFFVRHASAETVEKVQMLWCALLGAGTVAVCGLAGREIAGRGERAERLGLVAAAIAAVYPGLWVYDGALLSETIAIFMVALVVLLAYRYRSAPSLARLAWLSAACALAALSRAELILTFAFVVLPLVLLTRRISFARQVKWIASAACIAVLLVGPWVGYNLSRFDQRVYLSTGAGQTMAAANCDATYYGPNIGGKNYGCIAAVMKRVGEADRRRDRSTLDAAARKEAQHYIDEHLRRLPVVVLARWGRAAGVLDPARDVRFSIATGVESSVAWAQLYAFSVVAIAAVVGAVILRRRRTLLFPLLTFPVIVLLSVAATFGQVRYRASAEAVVVILAAVAVEAGWHRWRAGRAAVPDGAVGAPAVTESVAGAG